jgi:hypothetical protein
MTANKNGTQIGLKRTKARYIMIREDIHEALDLYTLSLYMAFRYESDYDQEDAIIKRSAKFLYEKAKISRRQFFISLNKLEDLGLVLRDSENSLNSISVYHVAQELGYFNTDCRGVHDMHGVVHHMHTDHYSLPLSNINITNSESCDSPTAATKNSKPNIDFRQLIDIYAKWFPDNPQPYKNAISNKLEKAIKTLIKRWPEAHPDKLKFTPEQFEKYMELLSTTAPKFSKGEYITSHGNKKKNTMLTFCSWDVFIQFLEGKYS